MHRRLAIAGVVVASLLALPPAASATVPHASSEKCQKPPMEVTVLPAPDGGTVAAPLAVKDAVAFRVPIVPRPRGATTGDPEELAKLRKQAAKTNLALYTLYLADFEIDRARLRSGFSEVSSPSGTVAALTIVPTNARGFRKGDVVTDGALQYDATTTFGPLSLIVNRSGTQARYAYDEVEGDVEIVELGKKSTCLAFDVTFTDGGRTVASATGTVRAPVVRSSPTFFFT